MARIARAVAARRRAVGKPRLEERRRRLLGVAEIAFGHRVAHDDDLARLPHGAGRARLGIDDEELGAGTRRAHRQRARVGQLRRADLDVGDGHGGFGGAVGVHDAGAREALAQGRGRGMAQGLAAEQEQARVGQHFLGEALVGQA